jgi:hypothetical protein
MNTLLQQWGKSMLTMGNIYFLLYLQFRLSHLCWNFPITQRLIRTMGLLNLREGIELGGSRLD